MIELSIQSFADYFEALWDFSPFSWQQTLAERVIQNIDQPWPEAIALPTASGKTACIDIAVFALATQASKFAAGDIVTAPRRIFFVVDRRIIVDEAYCRAERLADKLAKAETGILKDVADALRMVAAGGEKTIWRNELPLTFHTMRGASYNSDSWARSPLQPAVIASTVDQVGSRLLFRAYGRGSGMWPIYAGLVANDSLILLDEAHCAQPFLETLQAVGRYRKWGTASLHRSFHPVVLSATLPFGLGDVFNDDAAEAFDPRHPLGCRQLAHKPALIEKVKLPSGRGATRRFAEVLAAKAEKLAEESKTRNSGMVPAVVIFVNRVATARAVRDCLVKRPTNAVTLLTGRMRAIDKAKVIAKLDKLQFASSVSGNRKLEATHFVVATQTLEVGADLDFDVLVTECASFDSLRQRFGRLNRMGRAIDVNAGIFLRGDQEKGDDPVYGTAIVKTFEWLVKNMDEMGVVDFGVAYLPAPRKEELRELNSPIRHAPVMLPAHIDSLAQTSPVPKPSPDVGVFLHGPKETQVDVQVCWRVQPSEVSLKLCPPVSSEMLPVRLSIFRRWLKGEIIEDTSTDVEGEANIVKTSSDDMDILENRSVFIWNKSSTDRNLLPITHPNKVRPNDIVVIETGNTDESIHEDFQILGELPNFRTSPVEIDVSQHSYLESRAKAILRLHDKLIDIWPGEQSKQLARELLAEIELEDSDPEAQLDLVRRMLDFLVKESDTYCDFAWLQVTAKQLREEARSRAFLQNLQRVGERDIILSGRFLIREYVRQAETFNDEDDENSSGTANRQGQPILLRHHLVGVEVWARRFAVGCSLSEELAEAIARAGLLHDIGKVDPRFQAKLNGGRRMSAVSEPLAKSVSINRTKFMGGYPVGGRHELLSERLAASSPDLLPENDLLRELTLYLVSSHHGRCRPFAPVVIDDDAPEVSYQINGHEMTWTGPTQLENLSEGVPQRFWMLVEAYGWWGLAWLEAMLRLADHRRSEWEELSDESMEVE